VVAQGREWNGHSAGDDATGRLFRFTHIQENCTFCELFGQVVWRRHRRQSLQVVLCHQVEHVDGILGTAVGRGVGKFEVGEVVDGCSEAEGCGQDVDAFVHAVVAGGLSTEQLALGV